MSEEILKVEDLNVNIEEKSISEIYYFIVFVSGLFLSIF